MCSYCGADDEYFRDQIDGIVCTGCGTMQDTFNPVGIHCENTDREEFAKRIRVASLIETVCDQLQLPTSVRDIAVHLSNVASRNLRNHEYVHIYEACWRLGYPRALIEITAWMGESYTILPAVRALCKERCPDARDPSLDQIKKRNLLPKDMSLDLGSPEAIMSYSLQTRYGFSKASALERTGHSGERVVVNTFRRKHRVEASGFVHFSHVGMAKGDGTKGLASREWAGEEVPGALSCSGHFSFEPISLEDQKYIEFGNLQSGKYRSSDGCKLYRESMQVTCGSRGGPDVVARFHKKVKEKSARLVALGVHLCPLARVNKNNVRPVVGIPQHQRLNSKGKVVWKKNPKDPRSKQFLRDLEKCYKRHGQDVPDDVWKQLGILKL